MKGRKARPYGRNICRARDEEEKKKIGKTAVEDVLKHLTKKEELLELIEEFESMKTKESTFAKMCDKLEADIQCKIYCEENCIDINKKENEHLLKDSRVQKLLKNGEKTVADLYIENDRPRYTEKVFENIVDYIKRNNLLKLKEENM